MATVKGDVHDIGKNIVGVVLGCNNYEVIDIGVMVPADEIIRKAREHKVDVVGLSGLITPSLDEMVHVAKEMEREGLSVPLLIGGATTSRIHTAVKIAPQYTAPTVHVLDASRAVTVVQSLLDPNNKAAYASRVAGDYQQLREHFRAKQGEVKLVTLDDARAKAPAFDWASVDIPTPEFTGVKVFDNYPLEDLIPYIDWSPFFHTWELKGVYPAILKHPKWGERARELFDDARRMLDKLVASGRLRAAGVLGFFPANSIGDDIEVYTDAGRHGLRTTLHTLRQQTVREPGKPHLALADYIAPRSSGRVDHIGGFAVTAGLGVDEICAEYDADHDDYSSIMVKALADRLAEAFAERMHKHARDAWGYGLTEGLSNDDLIQERYPPRAGLSRVPRPHRKARAVRAARGRGRDGDPPDGELRHDAGQLGQRPVLRPPRQQVLRRRPHRPRPGRGLPPPQGHGAGRDRALAAPQPGVRSRRGRRRRDLRPSPGASVFYLQSGPGTGGCVCPAPRASPAIGPPEGRTGGRPGIPPRSAAP
jgi:5-methyltetrahydrofolate--homocysteine methyltransferase